MPDKLFTSEVAVITGAGQGIGFEIARQLALQGAAVLLNDIDEQLAAHAAALIQQENGKCLPLAGDVADADFLRRIVEEAVKQFGKLTIAVANAGITLFGDFFDYSPEAFQRVMKVNLSGSFFLAQAASLQM